MRDSMSYDTFQGKSQGHITVKVENSLMFKNQV